MGKFLFLAMIWLSFSANAADCDVKIVKTLWPIANTAEHSHLCLEDYFYRINLANQSQSENSGQTFTDLVAIQYHDMMLFETNSTPMGETGRVTLVKKIYLTAMQSLRNENGPCRLELFDGTQPLSLNDFLFYHREEGGQPGSRLMLTFEDVKNPNWKMMCKNQSGEDLMQKSGDYFFIFIDVYENIGTTKLQHHLAKYLLSLR